MDWKLTASGFFKLKFATDALLFGSAIVILPSDWQLQVFSMLILFILSKIAEYMEWHKLPLSIALVRK